MEIKSQSAAIEYLISSIPYPNQIRDIDLSYAPAVYFTWRSGRYKVELSTGSVDRVEGQCLIGDDLSILMRRLLEIETIKNL